jgi:short-subunit dehydrogenase
VTALCPGATDTAFFDTASDSASVGRRMAPAQVIAAALSGLDHGRSTVVRGWGTGCWQAPAAWPLGRQSRG